MIQLNVKCPHCKHDLLDKKHKIDGHPSARLLFECKEKKGELYLSSIYGNHNSKIPSFVSERDALTIFCPWCKASLMSTRKCEKCDAQMVLMDIEDGGNIQICSRKGCKKHFLEFEDLGTELKAFYNVYSTFFKGD
jgi:hypothetical protein